MKLNSSLAQVLAPAYGPCPGFAGPCKKLRWDPKRGHVPRGFLGAAGSLKEIELVLVFAEPGDPHSGESHDGLNSAYKYATNAFATGKDKIHKNVCRILKACWPDLSFEEQLKKVWMTESVLCSAKKEGGYVPVAIEQECGTRYLFPQLRLLSHAFVVALGKKAERRLQKVGFTDFLFVFAVAPPKSNTKEARESWDRIPVELRRKRTR